jgi:hypothetical protein
MITDISSRCHRDVGRGRRRRSSRANNGPNFAPFIGDIQPTLSEQIFDVAIAEGENADRAKRRAG